MKMSGRYALGLYAGIGGALLLIAINAFTIPDSLKQAEKRDRLTAEAELEQIKAEQAKKIADSYSRNGIANFNELIISTYVLSNTPPVLDWQRTVDPTRKTYLYDKNRLCIGYAHQGKFYFVKYYEGVCD
jgi:hypothetical protein